MKTFDTFKNNKGDVASKIESKKLNSFSNFRSVVSELCRIIFEVIERYRDASKLEFFNSDGG